MCAPRFRSNSITQRRRDVRGQRSGLHAQCNIEPPSTSYVLHSTAQVKMTGVTWMGTTSSLRDLGVHRPVAPPPPSPPPCTGCLTPVRPTGPQTEPTEIARFHSLRDPSLRPSATPNHNHGRAHSISVKYFSPAPSSHLLHVPVLSSRLDDFGWPCLTRRPRPSHPELLVILRRLYLFPRSLLARRQTSSSSSSSRPTPGPSSQCRARLPATVESHSFCEHWTPTRCICEVEYSPD